MSIRMCSVLLLCRCADLPMSEIMHCMCNKNSPAAVFKGVFACVIHRSFMADDEGSLLQQQSFCTFSSLAAIIVFSAVGERGIVMNWSAMDIRDLLLVVGIRCSSFSVFSSFDTVMNLSAMESRVGGGEYWRRIGEDALLSFK